MKRRIVLTYILVLFLLAGMAQTQVPVFMSQPPAWGNSNGYYQYLPADYNISGKNYPLIIWIHGAGQVGQGNASDLPKVLQWGLPKLISQGQFPAQFTAAAGTFSFIVISPQFTYWPSGINVDVMLNYIIDRYRVDRNRVYLMGISAGGGAVWDYASASVANSNKLAAIIPFAGTSIPTTAAAHRMASANLPVWAFHNTQDGTVPVEWSRNWVSFINSHQPVPRPVAKLTEFNVISNDAVIAHDSWSVPTLTSYKPNGINIYEWLLGYSRNHSSPTIPNTAPIANAGADVTTQLPQNQATLDGRQSRDAEGVIQYSWALVSGPEGSVIQNPTASLTTVSFVNAGTYNFRLTVTDAGQLSATDQVIVTVIPAATITVKAIKVNLYGGFNPYNNAQWNNWNVSGSSTSTRLSYTNGTYSNVTASLTAGGILTDNGQAYAPNAILPPSPVLRYSSANTSHRTLTINGLDPAKTYHLEFYASRANTGNSTVLTVGALTDTISTSFNVNDYAKFNTVRPNGSGKILVKLSRIGTWNYLSGFSITEVGSAPLISNRSSGELNDVSDNLSIPVNVVINPDKLSVYPNPVNSLVNITFPTSVKGRYRILLITMDGNTVMSTSGNRTAANFTQAISLASVQKGVYILEIRSEQATLRTSLIKL